MAGKREPPQQLRLLVARSAREPRVGEQRRGDLGIDRRRALGERQRIVAIDGDGAHATAGGVEPVHHLGARRLEPVAIHRARDADQRRACLSRPDRADG